MSRHGGSIHNLSGNKEPEEGAAIIDGTDTVTCFDRVEIFDKNYLQVCLRRQDVDDNYMKDS
jgi:hypothetical protein